MNIRKSLAAYLLLFLISGCTSINHHVPNASPIQADSAPVFYSEADISLFNNQSSAEPVLFATNGGHKWYADLQKWTDVAIEISEREISKRGMNVTEHASKKLMLSIVSANTTSGGWAFRSRVVLNVVAGNGYNQYYPGDEGSLTLDSSANAAFMMAIGAMLNDEKIQDYLIAK